MPTFRIARSLLAFAAFDLSLAACAVAQEGPRQEGDLKASINTEAEDLGIKVEAMRHAIDALDQRMIQVTFHQRCGDRVRMEPALYPNRGASDRAFDFLGRKLIPGARPRADSSLPRDLPADARSRDSASP